MKLLLGLRWIPSPPFPIATKPNAPTPIELPCTVVPNAVPLMAIPLPVLPQMSLPLIVEEDEFVTLTPLPELPIALWPLTFRPMLFPSTEFGLGAFKDTPLPVLP